MGIKAIVHIKAICVPFITFREALPGVGFLDKRNPGAKSLKNDEIIVEAKDTPLI